MNEHFLFTTSEVKFQKSKIYGSQRSPEPSFISRGLYLNYYRSRVDDFIKVYVLIDEKYFVLTFTNGHSPRLVMSKKNCS